MKEKTERRHHLGVAARPQNTRRTRGSRDGSRLTARSPTSIVLAPVERGGLRRGRWLG